MESAVQEDQEVQVLPELPEIPSEPKKDRKGALKWAAIGLGIVVALGVGGTVAQGEEEVTNPVAGGQLESGESFDSTPTDCVDTDEVTRSGDLMYGVADDMTVGISYLEAGDVDGAASAIEAGAAKAQEAASIWTSIDSVTAQHLQSSADHMLSSASYLRNYDMGPATSEMELALADSEAARAGINSLDPTAATAC